MEQQFQSAPPHGERRKLKAAKALIEEFQSAPPHGERPGNSG